jgi:hypothetical protein
MSGDPTAFSAGHGNKTEFLRACDLIGNGATRDQLGQIRAALVAGLSFIDIYNKFKPLLAAVTASEQDHFVKHWLGGGWWPALPVKPEEVLREGIINVIDLQLEERMPRKVDYWWVIDSQGFRVVPCVGPGLVTVIILTPTPPGS